jgi:CCR4-NOT transcriptional complex subunit CAF120
MFEHTSLQELYTGSLIAGKGKLLNNIRTIMERSKFRTEDWARVRFGAGTPWRRCWCVIDPPNEKEFQKEQKSLKKRSVYERPVIPKGDIKFYDNKKTKKATPIATITDAYSAYAIYPQSKPLIDQSTLVKVEGRITIHSKPESKTEGFVFVMPEVHPAVSGFEMMLRWLFPVYDTFGLYGRPTRLIADTLDNRGLMFAMPKERRYGYLDIQDVAALVCKDGSQSWTEQDWRQQMKDVTSRRLSNTASRTTSRQGSRKGVRTSLPAGTNLRYEDGASIRSTPSQRHKYNQSTDNIYGTPQKTRTAPPGGSLTSATYHARSASDTLAFSNSPRKRQEQYVPSRLSTDQDREAVDRPPPPPMHGKAIRKSRPGDIELPKPRMSFDNEPEQPVMQEPDEVGSDLRPQPPPTPVAAPPAFLHSPGERPSMRPNASPDLRRANSRMSIATLNQLVDASKSGTASKDGVAAAGAAAAWKNNESSRSQDQAIKGVNETIDRRDSPADQRLPRKGLVAGLNHTETVSSDSPRARRIHDSAQRSDEAKLIHRKPVRTDEAMASAEHNLTREGSVGGYTTTRIANTPFASREDTDFPHSSQNRDGDSTHDTDTSVDYASTRESSEGQRSEVSIPKQRTGVLRTVGNPNHTDTAIPKLETDTVNRHSPTTQGYSPGARLGSGTLGAGNASPRWDHSRTPSDSLTPKDDRRSSYLGGVSPNGSNPRSHSRSPNPGDRTVAWQPGATAVGSGRKSPGPRITPEVFVQQRATANRAVTPVYAHQRNNRSTGHLPQERPSSADWSKRKEAGTRPSSGDASAMLAQQQSYSNNLSAKEQEHVARITNSPLLNINARRTPSPQVSPGLVGAIQAREQEKKQVRQGISGQMVQQAIAQRQQQAQQQHQAYQRQSAVQQVQQQAQQQAQAFSGQSQAYQAQVAAGFFSQPQPQSRSTPNSPGGWGMLQPNPGLMWPNPQTQTYWGGLQPQQQAQPQGGQQYRPEGQVYPRKPTTGQK